MTKIQIFTHVIVPLLGVLLAYITAIKVKFAKTKKEAMYEAKTLIIIILNILIFCLIGYFLFKELTSIGPLTKFSFFTILVYSFVLFNFYITWQLQKIYSLFIKFSKTLTDILEMSKEQNQIIKEQNRIHEKHLHITKKLTND